MSSNGRRRWRKWLRRDRQRKNDVGLTWGLAKERTATGRRHGGLEWAAASLPYLAETPIPRPAFAARSLVGMTGGAKRRAVRKRSSFPFGGTRYHELRAKYRIGERLRPCVCGACAPGRAPHSVQSYIMQPWGWSQPRKDIWRHVPIPSGTPCLILDDDGCAFIIYYIGGTKRTAEIERQYLSMEPVRVCSGDGLLPARRARKVRG